MQVHISVNSPGPAHTPFSCGRTGIKHRYMSVGTFLLQEICFPDLTKLKCSAAVHQCEKFWSRTIANAFKLWQNWHIAQVYVSVNIPTPGDMFSRFY